MSFKLAPKSDWRKGIRVRQKTVIMIPNEAVIRLNKNENKEFFEAFRDKRSKIFLPKKSKSNFRVYIPAGAKIDDVLVIHRIFKDGCICKPFKIQENKKAAVNADNTSKELSI